MSVPVHSSQVPSENACCASSAPTYGWPLPSGSPFVIRGREAREQTSAAAAATATMSDLRIDSPLRRFAERSRVSDGSLGFPAMEAEDLGLDTHRDLQGVYRYYELAKRAEWQVRDLPWGEIPPIPEYSGSPQKLARRRDLWRSVITQQLQADELAVEMATQLFSIAPDHEAKLYYTTMVQDESRHTEAWLKLIAESGGMTERDPHLDQLAHMTLDADTLEEKVFVMQVFYERLIIPRFRMIARSSRGTILEDLCNRLTIDDGIHHGAGMAYERVLLEGAGRGVQTKLDRRREPDAAGLHPARAVAAEGARVHRRADARDRHPHAQGRPGAGRPAREVTRDRRQRHRAPADLH